MIVVAGRVKVKPEAREEAVRAAVAMSRATEREAGCLSYRFYSDVEDPDTFFVFEEWESAEALAAHFETSHMKVFREVLPRLVAGGMEIKQYEVSSAGPA